MDYSIEEKIAEHVDMFKIAADYGLYSGSNDESVILCPIHQEQTPSARFYDDGLLYCFGCHTMITPVKFIMHTEDLGFWKAVVFLEKKYGFHIPRDDSGEYVKYKQDLYEELEGRLQDMRFRIPFKEYLSLWQKYDRGSLRKEHLEEVAL
jgi:DNA primase